MINDLHTTGRASDPQAPKILRHVHGRDHWPRHAPSGLPVRRVAIIDTEAEGLDPLRHGLLEIAVAIVFIDDAGDIVAIERVITSLRDPGRPLSRDIQIVTGLTDADVAGKSIDPQSIVDKLSDVSAVVAFNSGFDRAMVEQFAPDLAHHRWGCAMKDIDWRHLGVEPGSQGYVLSQLGYYNPRRHRALDDVQSLITILAHVADDGESIMAKLMQAIERPAWRFEAKLAPYRFKDDLKDWRYSWSGKHRCWHRHVRAADFRYEYARYRDTIGQRPAVVPLPPEERYRADWTWRPA